jgi:flagellar export protein FliJ
MAPKFSLQNVLDYRHSKVEKLEVVFGRVQNQLQAAHEKLISMETEKQRLMKELGSYQSGNIDLQTVLQARTYLKRIQKGIDVQQIEIKRLTVEVEIARSALVEAKQDEVALEKLSEKELQTFTDKVNVREKQQQDDIYISQAHTSNERKMRERMQNVRFVF